MNYLLSIFILTFPLWASPQNNSRVNWQDLEKDQALVLEMDLEFFKNNQDSLKLDKGMKYFLKDLYPLDGISVIFIELETPDCRPEVAGQIAEMIIVNPTEDSTPRDRSVGVALDLNCRIEIFVETVDFSTNSFFSNPQDS
jgi:hypothetical protein